MPDALAVTEGLPLNIEHLTLSNAEQLFLAHSRELLAARRALDAAQADQVAASQRPNPQLSVNVSSIPPRNSVGWGAGPVWEKGVDTVVGMTQLIERGGKRELRTEAAQRIAEATQNDLVDTLVQQKLAFKVAFFNLLLTQERTSISEETVSLFRKTVEAAALRLKAGDIAASDLARLKVDSLRAENDARQNRAELQRAQLDLAYFLGLEASAPRIQAADVWPSAAAEPEKANLDALVARRPDVQAAQLRVGAAQKNRDLARAARTRDVTVGAQFEHFPGDFSNNTWGMSVSVPLFLFYRFDGEIKRAEVALLAAEDALDRARALASAQIQRSWADLESARARVKRFNDELLTEARRAADAAEFAYKRGATGVMDLLDSRRTLYATRLDAVAALADYAKSLAAWEAATAIQTAAR